MGSWRLRVRVMCEKVNDYFGSVSMAEDLENELAEVKQMLFNVDKFKIMQIGYNYSKAKYEMNGKYLEEVTVERDLMLSDLKCSS